MAHPSLAHVQPKTAGPNAQAMRLFGTRLAVVKPAGFPGRRRYTHEMQSVWRDNLWMRQGRQVQLRERLRLREEASGGQVDGPPSSSCRASRDAFFPRGLGVFKGLYRVESGSHFPFADYGSTPRAFPAQVSDRLEASLSRHSSHVRWITCIIATLGRGVIQRGRDFSAAPAPSRPSGRDGVERCPDAVSLPRGRADGRG